MKINPSDLRALSALKKTYPAQQGSSSALQKVQEYASRQPQSAPVQHFLGMLLLAAGERERARRAFRSATTADSNYQMARLSLVQMDVLEGRLDQARESLEGITVRDKSNTTALLWLGELEEVKGNHRAALNAFRNVLQTDPANAAALNNLAYLLSEYFEQPNEALKYAEKAQELSPDDAEFADTMGWILYRKGLYPSAVRQLERAAPRSTNAVWKYHLAMAYAKVGEAGRARASLDAALKLNPNVREAKMARDVFGQLP